MNPVVLELVYEKLMSSISIDVACAMHRMMKKGVYPSSELLVPKSRSDIYPEVYAGQKTVETEEASYSVFVPQRNKRKRAGEEDNTTITEYVRTSVAAKVAAMAKAASDKAENAATTPENSVSNPPEEAKQPPVSTSAPIPPAAAAVPPPTPHYLDIWGKMPPKEPKQMLKCHICKRQVNTLRFAPHLDKCMGIGTTVRAAAMAASGFVPQQLPSASSGAVAKASFSGVGNMK